MTRPEVVNPVPPIEPLPIGQAWTRAHRFWRPHVSLREEDRRQVLGLMAGRGHAEGTFLRYLVQLGILAEQCRLRGSIGATDLARALIALTPEADSAAARAATPPFNINRET